MNLTINNLNLPATAAKTPAPVASSDATGAALPLQDGAAVGLAPAPAAAQGAPVQPALAFAQWLGLEQFGPVVAEGAANPDADIPATETAAGQLPVAETPLDEQQPAFDNTLFGAMSAPLMPVAQATLAAVVAALPGIPAPKEAQPAAATDIALPVATGAATHESHASHASHVSDQSRRERAPVELAAALPVTPAAVAVTPAAAAAPAQHAAAPAALPKTDTPAAAEAPQDSVATASTERGAAHTAGIATPAAGSTMRGADTVTLSGPPTAWRQTLQEALGERLQLQVGKNAEQAVIRLEPPMLGRVEIAIRHSAGSLEVHISATHGEVLRQLQSVGDNLRNDLAQRQFTDVSVNIAAAPRGAAASANNLFAGDGGGRGRQQDGRQEEQQPGQALAEAHNAASPFSLNGRAAA